MRIRKDIVDDNTKFGNSRCPSCGKFAFGWDYQHGAQIEGGVMAWVGRCLDCDFHYLEKQGVEHREREKIIVELPK